MDGGVAHFQVRIRAWRFRGQSKAGRSADNEVELRQAWDPRWRLPGAAYHWSTVANTAVAWTVRAHLPSASSDTAYGIAALEARLATVYRRGVSADAFARSVALGQTIASTLARWAATDGFAGLNNCAFRGPVGEGRWTPTPRGAFHAEAREVYQTIEQVTAGQAETAAYWSDDPGWTGTPPDHSLILAVQMIEQHNLALDAAAEALARVGIAVADAFIACWHTKFKYNVVRPVTYVRDVLADRQWAPLLSTPPFPEYTSGHSVQSAAAQVHRSAREAARRGQNARGARVSAPCLSGRPRSDS